MRLNFAFFHLSFQMLIADPARAFGHDEQGESMEYHYITTTEFTRLLEQLYANNYILVSLDDFIATQSSQTGEEVMTFSPLRLPAGKKPLMLTQTNVNYDQFLVDEVNLLKKQLDEKDILIKNQEDRIYELDYVNNSLDEIKEYFAEQLREYKRQE